MKDLRTFINEAKEREYNYMWGAADGTLKAPKTLSAIEKEVLCVICDSTDPIAQMKDYETMIAFAHAVKDWVKKYKVKKVRYVINAEFVRDTLKMTQEKWLKALPYKVDVEFAETFDDMLDMVDAMKVVASEHDSGEDAEYNWGTYEGKPAFHVRIGDFSDGIAIAI